MSFPLEYIRTDRNGTKIYHDWNCSRCGGAGQAGNTYKNKEAPKAEGRRLYRPKKGSKER